MKIIVIIPTLNEVENIASVTRIIDHGLKSMFQHDEVIIVNSDGGSTDGTTNKFLTTKTFFSKQVILDKKSTGKGNNIYNVLKKYRNEADYYLMIDADVISAKSEWVNKLLNPLLENKAELVIPMYRRNRYEGNTTNHFSSPLIYLCFDKYISQPIAGEFSFTKKLARKIYKSFYCNSDFGYGIDTLITWTALLENFRIVQVRLGQKIHKPSFSKIVFMFDQVSNTTMYLLNKHRNIIKKRIAKNTYSERIEIQSIDDKNVSKPIESRVVDVKSKAEKLLHKKQNILGSREWVDILWENISKILYKKVNKLELKSVCNELTGNYLLRVLGYFKDIEKKDISNVKDILKSEILYLVEKVRYNS